MNLKLLVTCMLALSCQLVSATAENDSSTSLDTNKTLAVQAAKAARGKDDASWWQKATRWTLGIGTAAVVAGKTYLPDFVQTGIGYAAKPITWAVSKVTGWEDWMDMLASEGLLTKFISGLVLGKMTGFSDSEKSHKEIALIARILKLAKNYVAAKEDPKRVPDPEERKEFHQKVKKLYGRLTQPGSFSINVCHALAHELLVKRKMLESVLPQTTNEDFVEFATSSGLAHLDEAALGAMPVLLINFMSGDFSKGMFEGNISDTIMKKMKFGNEILAGVSFMAKIKRAYNSKQHQDRKKDLLAKRRARGKETKKIEMVLPNDETVQAAAPPELKDKVVSGMRQNINLMVLLFLSIIICTLFGCAYRSGLIQPPTSNFQNTIGEKKVDIYVASDMRDIDEEMKAAELV